jgi:hypothetical protein
VMLPPRAVRRLDKTISHHIPLDTGPSGTVPPNSSPTIESDAPTAVAPETAKNPLPRT